MANPRSKNVEARNTQRPKRRAITDRSVLFVPNKEPGWMYRWVNDTKGGYRIKTFLEDGYEFVQDPQIELGDGVRPGTYEGMGSAVQLHTGEGTISYLMRIPEDVYQEYQNSKFGELDEIEAGMKQKEGLVGKIDLS